MIVRFYHRAVNTEPLLQYKMNDTHLSAFDKIEAFLA